MGRETFLQTAALLVLAGLTAAAATAQQSPDQQTSDPVAEAARKARAEKQAAPKPKKVYTDEDFASSKNATPATPASTGAAEGQPAATDQTAADAVKGGDTKGERYWRKRFKAAHDKLDQAEQELDVLQRELNKDQVQYYNDPQKALMQQYDRKDINEKTAKIDAKKKEIESLKQQLSDMEDELRKANGDPGWAR